MHHGIPDEIQLVVPYLSEQQPECSASDFEKYPAKQGFDVDDLVKQFEDISTDRLAEFASFLQEWLIFGLLRKTLEPSGISIQLDDFVFSQQDPDDSAQGNHDANLEHASSEIEGATSEDQIWRSGKEVHMGKIPIYILYLVAEESHLSDSERRERLWAEHLRTFGMVNATVNKILVRRRECSQLSHDGQNEPPVFDLIVLSIVLLVESLFDACQRLFTIEDTSVEWELDNAIRWWLLNAGWCPGEVTLLQRKLIHSTSLYIVSSFNRRCLDRDHTNCDQDVCRADQLDEETYKTKHATDNCDCVHVGANHETTDQIASILQRNAVPVIQVEYTSDGGSVEIHVSVRPSTSGSYVAISHVWSDGLGNPKQNTLPRCQLERLQQYVNDLYPNASESVSFWIDTICVPLQRELRKTAISLMAQTYGDADQVLVLDNWLIRGTGLVGIEREDMLKVKSCTWSQRLWTLQEGNLPQKNKLWFQTRLGPFNESQIYGKQETNLGTRFMNDVIGSEADSLYAINTTAAEAMNRSIERYQEIKQNAALSRPGQLVPFGPSEDPSFPWEQDDHMLRLIDTWYIHDFIWIEGRNYFTEMRDRSIGETAVLQANRTAIVGYSMRFRSTSRIEDEPICFATLLGQDPRPLFQENTVEGRMKIVAANMKYVNVMILFSDMPRIDVDGFRWAPLSFRSDVQGKAKSPGLTFTKFAEVQPEGLLVKLQAITLDQRIINANNADARIRVRLDDQELAITIKRKIKNISRLGDKKLALVVRYQLQTLARGGSDAVLVGIRTTEGETTFADLLSLCSIQPSPGADGSATIGRMRSESKWCIG